MSRIETNNVVERLIAAEILREDAEFVLRHAHETIAPYAAERLRKAALTVQSLSDRIDVLEGERDHWKAECKALCDVVSQHTRARTKNTPDSQREE